MQANNSLNLESMRFKIINKRSGPLREPLFDPVAASADHPQLPALF
jgi:hypothetical protein